MRLLSVHTLELKNFHEHQIPPYIILSHTWGSEGDEVTFQEMTAGSATRKRGYRKITDFCLTVRRRSPQTSWVWVDTCCIDKTSSAELSEAINSMFRWYTNARSCYAYLEDVHDIHASFEAAHNLSSRVGKARWFTRAWCLQELIAPPILEFFGIEWNYIGTKEELSMGVAEITGIDKDLLARTRDLTSFSIAQRMSWASRRTATRREDIAYCLLGIFGVHMPLIYGEGENSFIRLQEGILANSDDHSILAWSEEDPSMPTQSGLFLPRLPNMNRKRGVLARSPMNFKHAARLIHHPVTGEPYSMTNKGLRIELPMLGRWPEWIAVLNCHYEDNLGGPIGIQLRGNSRHELEDLIRCSRIATAPVVVFHRQLSEAKTRILYISKEENLLEQKRSIHRADIQKKRDLLCCQLRSIPEGWELAEALFTSIEGASLAPIFNWDLEAWTMNLPLRRPYVTALRFRSQNGTEFVLAVELHYSFHGNIVPVVFEQRADNKPLSELLQHHARHPISQTMNQFVAHWSNGLHDETLSASVGKDLVFGVEVFILKVYIAKHIPEEKPQVSWKDGGDEMFIDI